MPFDLPLPILPCPLLSLPAVKRRRLLKSARGMGRPPGASAVGGSSLHPPRPNQPSQTLLLSGIWHSQPSSSLGFSSVQSLSRARLFVTSWTAARQASLPITNSQSLFKLMSIESVMPSNHLTLRRPLLLPPSIFPSIRVFSNESALHIRWPKYWSFSFNISPSNEHSGLISFRMD